MLRIGGCKGRDNLKVAGTDFMCGIDPAPVAAKLDMNLAAQARTEGRRKPQGGKRPREGQPRGLDAPSRPRAEELREAYRIV